MALDTVEVPVEEFTIRVDSASSRLEMEVGSWGGGEEGGGFRCRLAHPQSALVELSPVLGRKLVGCRP
jgi:hypothetical protein